MGTQLPQETSLYLLPTLHCTKTGVFVFHVLSTSWLETAPRDIISTNLWAAQHWHQEGPPVVSVDGNKLHLLIPSQLPKYPRPGKQTSLPPGDKMFGGRGKPHLPKPLGTLPKHPHPNLFFLHFTKG